MKIDRDKQGSDRSRKKKNFFIGNIKINVNLSLKEIMNWIRLKDNK